MKATIFFNDEHAISGGATPMECKEINNFLSGLQLDLERIPNQGEWMQFYFGNYSVMATVRNICTSYGTQSNRHIQDGVKGITYEIFLDNVELLETFD